MALTRTVVEARVPSTLPSAVVGALADDNLWSSSQNSDNANNAWYQNFGNGNQNDNNKDNDNRVRPVRGFQRGQVRRAGLDRAIRGTGPARLDWVQGTLFKQRPAIAVPMGEVDIADLLEAYRQCRSNKRRTVAAMEFESDYESNLVDLWRRINQGSYRPDPATAFVVAHPVPREIFAATFPDRVVHHYLIGKIGPVLERDLIHDVYACRAGQGTLMGVRRLERFTRQCSAGYRRDCYVLRLDISGFFMAIDRSILLDRVEGLLLQGCAEPELGRLIWLLREVVLAQPTEDCRIRGRRRDWAALPPGKSLFDSPAGCGLPIGNLTSQVLANAYLSPLDHFVKSDLGIRFYGRYVDDIVLVHQDRRVLAQCVGSIDEFLRQRLALRLHPRKITLTSHGQGVRFLGTVIKPGRTYIGSRTKGGLHHALRRHALQARQVPSQAEAAALMATVNSYLGLMRHFATRRLRRRMLREGLGRWWQYVYAGKGFGVIRIRSEASLRSGSSPDLPQVPG